MNHSTKAKGCAGLTIFFVLLFIWGVWSVWTIGATYEEVQANIQSYAETKVTDPFDGKVESRYAPTVSYSYQGKNYITTIQSEHYEMEWDLGAQITVYVNPDNPEEISIDSPDSSAIFYFVYLILAAISFESYRRLKNRGDSKSIDVKVDIQANDSINDSQTSSRESIIHEKPTEPLVPKSEQAPKWMIFLIGTLVMAVGLGFGYYKVTTVQLAKELKTKGVAVYAYVTDYHHTGRLSEQQYTYTLSYKFEGADYSYNTTYKMKLYELSDTVALLIDPKYPERAMIDSEFDQSKGSYLWTVILLGLGGGIFWLGFKRN